MEYGEWPQTQMTKCSIHIAAVCRYNTAQREDIYSAVQQQEEIVLLYFLKGPMTDKMEFTCNFLPTTSLSFSLVNLAQENSQKWAFSTKDQISVFCFPDVLDSKYLFIYKTTFSCIWLKRKVHENYKCSKYLIWPEDFSNILKYMYLS